MKKILSYILPLIVAFFALIPPIKFYLLPPPFELWPMMIAVFGFLGIRILFIKTNCIVKAIPVLTFINCFFSAAPYMSFNQYCSVVICCYFYIGLTRMDSWKPMFATFKSLLILNSILLIIQLIGHDQLFNMGLDRIAVYGVVGQHMQMGSFSVVLGACLSIINPWFFLFPAVVALITNSTWTLFCAGLGLFLRSESRAFRVVSILLLIGAVVMCVKTGKIQEGLSDHAGRLTVWKHTIRLLNERPLEGWGLGSFKYIFPSMSGMNSIPWKQAHNCWLQFAFEVGYILFLPLLAVWFLVVTIAVRHKRWIFLAGLLVISVDMLVHFPTRLIQCVPLIICFLAYAHTYHPHQSIHINFHNDRL